MNTLQTSGIGTATPTRFPRMNDEADSHWDNFAASGTYNYSKRNAGHTLSTSGTDGTYGAVGTTINDIGSPGGQQGSATFGGLINPVNAGITFGQQFEDISVIGSVVGVGTLGSWSVTSGGGEWKRTGSGYIFATGGASRVVYDGVDFKNDVVGSVVGISFSLGGLKTPAGTSTFISFGISGTGGDFDQIGGIKWDNKSTYTDKADILTLLLNTETEQATAWINGSSISSIKDLSPITGGYNFFISAVNAHIGSFFMSVPNYIDSGKFPTAPMQVGTSVTSDFDSNATSVSLTTQKTTGFQNSGTWSFNSESGIQLSADNGATWTNIREDEVTKIGTNTGSMMLKFLPDGSTFPSPMAWSSNPISGVSMNFPVLKGYHLYTY
jgi:hypothetical protein